MQTKENGELIFDSLKEKCTYYRGLTDYMLPPKSYTLVMLDGRSFSRKVKKRFKQPFDSDFINMMNETARYLCKNIQGCRGAYVQSDEISLILTDFTKENTTPFFGGRMCKILSICASIAASKFNNLYTQYCANKNDGKLSTEDVEALPLFEFDCKAWTVPTLNDVIAWFIWRQNDCIRNSKQQAAQTYLSHSTLNGLDTDEQVELLKTEKGIDWVNDFNDGEKFGRFIIPMAHTLVNDKGEEYTRHRFEVQCAKPLNDKNNNKDFVEAIGFNETTTQTNVEH